MAYLMICEDELEETVALLKGKGYVYKFLFDSSNKDDYHEGKLGITKLPDSMVFATHYYDTKPLRYKQVNADAENQLAILLSKVFADESHVSMINDAYVHKNLVFVLSRIMTDGMDKTTTLSDDVLNELKKEFISELRVREGIKIYSLDLFRSGKTIDEEKNYDFFIETQKNIFEETDIKIDEKLITQFNNIYKYKVLAIYAKLKYYDLDEIMEVFEDMGYLDSRFDDCLISEENAKRILAKRLTAISLKTDIELLIKRGVLKKDSIMYNL